MAGREGPGLAGKMLPWLFCSGSGMGPHGAGAQPAVGSSCLCFPRQLLRGWLWVLSEAVGSCVCPELPKALCTPGVHEGTVT